MANIVVVGAQWGDEGKGKVVDYLAKDADIIARYQGGNNAGHTVVVNDEKYILHLIPSGILHPGKKCVIGNGVVLSPKVFLDEVDSLRDRGVNIGDNLAISDRAHMIMPYHILMESVDGENKRIGTTNRGIGPTYVDKVGRSGIRVGDLLDFKAFEEKLEFNLEKKTKILGKSEEWMKSTKAEILDEYKGYAERLKPFIADTSVLLHKAIKAGKSILFESAQGTLLDIDLGTYPYCTSSNPTAGGACAGLGVGPTNIDEVVGVLKAYTTRVGEGPFPTELPPDIDEMVRQRGQEFGATTGRKRRCGWFDAVIARYAVRVNGFTGVAVTKLDILDEMETLKLCVGYNYNGELRTEFPGQIDVLDNCEPVYESMDGWLTDISKISKYEELPENARKYIERISQLIETKIKFVAVGPERDRIIVVE